MKDSVIVECDKCGWLHFSVTEEYVQAWEKEWRLLFLVMDKEWLAGYGIVNEPPNRKSYLKCFGCQKKSNFFISKKDVTGRTLQPILWEKK